MDPAASVSCAVSEVLGAQEENRAAKIIITIDSNAASIIDTGFLFNFLTIYILFSFV